MRKCRVYVQIINTGGFFASCRVHGSDEFPDRQTLTEAESDARSHGVLEHTYPPEVLEEHERLTHAKAE